MTEAMRRYAGELLGRLDDARRVIAQLRAITPAVMHEPDYWRNPKHREFFLSGLRLAMGETA